jgi:putative cell wall-binding protein
MKKLCTVFILCFTMLFQFVPAFTVQAAAISYSRLGGSDRYATSVLISQNGWTQANTVIIATGLNYPDALAASSLSKSKDAPILLTGTNAMDQTVVNEIERLNATQAILVGGTDVIGTGVETQLKSLGINSITRLDGANRYDTSAKVGGIVGVNNGIIIATGLNFPDALSIAPIAAIKSIPILLTPQNALDPYVSAFIANKSIPVSYIAGGSDVVSDSVANSVPNSKRLSGDDRYATNISIINQFAGSLNFDTVYLATGLNFPDALSGSALAAKHNAPIILTEKDTISQAAIDLIKSKGVKNVVVLGGTDVVSQSVIDAINGVIVPTSVSLNKTTDNLIIGETDTLVATVSPDNATDKSVTWKSSNSNVTVDAAGKIKAVSEGQATITATTVAGGKTASCDVTITSPPVSATGNLAYGRVPTSSTEFSNLKAITDGDRNNDNYADSYTNTGLQWVQIDLGKSYDVNYIRLLHYYGDGREYHDVIVQISDYADFSQDVATVYNNDSDGSAGLGKGSDSEYTETSSGLDIAIGSSSARYVRCYSSGSTENNYSHYVEIEVYSEVRRSTFDNASEFLNVPTYDGEDMSVHPSVVYFKNAWHGYHYWMVSTPYPYSNDAYENPEITASNDGINWVVPNGASNPLVQRPAVGHNCDPELFYNSETDELWIYYLEANDINTTYVKFLKSSNGVSWTSAKTIITDSRSAYETISPTVDYIASKNLYYMWSVNLGNETLGQKDNYVELRTSSDGINWSNPQTISNFTQDGAEVWHIYIRYIPTYNEFWCIFAAYPDGSNVGDTMLYYSKSSDGINWTTYYNSPILEKGAAGTWDEGNVYRSCFVYNADTDLMKIWYSSVGAGAAAGIWGIGYTDNKFTNMYYNLIY